MSLTSRTYRVPIASPKWGRVVTILARRVTMKEAERGDPAFLQQALHELQQSPAA
jgi:hypothetical protein